MTSSVLSPVATVVFNTESQPTLKVAANCYRPLDSNRDGFTLILAHGMGNHKEHWEPLLFDLFKTTKSVREAWAFDWQTCGESAEINEEALKSFPNGISMSEWAKAFACFAKERLLEHRLVGIGYSGGANAMMYSSIFDVPYEAMVLVEPSMVDPKVFNANKEDRLRQIERLTKTFLAQKNTWESRQAAYEWMKAKYPWKSWDERALRIYCDKGLRSVAGSNGPVTTKCNKNHEAAVYSDFEPTFKAFDQISRVALSIRLHFIFGEINDLVPRYTQDSLTNGNPAASVVRVPRCGHSILQQRPDALASAIDDILRTGAKYQSKL